MHLAVLHALSNVHNRLPRRPPFLLVLSEGIGVTSSVYVGARTWVWVCVWVWECVHVLMWGWGNKKGDRSILHPEHLHHY